jgi:NAD(P)-dependent dehydrogenase (short-subunit alcohol dehydrogenase family)
MKKTIIVTGAAGGLGSIVARLLAQRECKVICTDLDGNALGKLARSIGSEAVPVAADLGSSADVKRVIDSAEGKIDGLFFGAAINGEPDLLHKISEETFERVIRTNLKSIWLGLKYALPIMLQNGGGSIVTVGSVAALRGAPTLGIYAASKHGVVGLTQTVALEYAKQGIRANILCPGSMDTQLIQPMLHSRGQGDPAKGLAATVAGIPNGRLAKPEELANTGIWLLLDAPTHLTGQSIVLDGGRTAG